MKIIELCVTLSRLEKIRNHTNKAADVNESNPFITPQKSEIFAKLD